MKTTFTPKLMWIAVALTLSLLALNTTSLRAQEATPAAPSLIAPDNWSFTNDTAPDLSWSAVPDAVQYEWQLASNRRFTADLQTGLVSDPTTSVIPSTLPDTDRTLYYWRVRGVNSFGIPGDWSTTGHFILDTTAPDAPSLRSPDDQSTTTNRQPAFIWRSVYGAIRYDLQLGTSNPPTPVISGLSGYFYSPPAPLLLATYYWRVRAVDAAGNVSDWSTTRSLEIVSPLTAAPDVNRSDTPTPTLSWSPISWTDPDGYYQVQVDNHTGFFNPEYVSPNIPTGTQSVTVDPLPNGIWYWRVRACTADSVCGDWSTTGTFTIESP